MNKTFQEKCDEFRDNLETFIKQHFGRSVFNRIGNTLDHDVYYQGMRSKYKQFLEMEIEKIENEEWNETHKK